VISVGFNTNPPRGASRRLLVGVLRAPGSLLAKLAAAVTEAPQVPPMLRYREGGEKAFAFNY